MRIYMIGMLFNMKHINSKFVTLLIILNLAASLSSCEKVVNSMSKSWMLNIEPPPGPHIYQTAYIDGCSAGMQENHDNIFAMRNRVYKHPVYNNTSNLYRRMWRSAMTYCYLWFPKTDRNRGSFFVPDFKWQVKGLPGSKKRNLLTNAPPGPPNFRVGWKDGCDTGKAATGENKHKMKFGFKKDPRFIEGDKFNGEYERGWETAFWYCQRFYDIYTSPERRNLL